MQLSQLLMEREALMRKMRLSNLAYAYAELSQVVARINRAQLQGLVSLQQPVADRPWPLLVAKEGSQSILEEHFTDEDIVDLANLFAFVFRDCAGEVIFRWEDLAGRFLGPLKEKLERAGVTIQPQIPSSSSADLEEGRASPNSS